MNIFETVFYDNHNKYNHLGPIFYINLKKRQDRYKHINTELNKVNLTGTRFDAHTGERGYRARIACKNSHLSIIENAFFLKINHILILEDDAIFDDDFIKISKNCFENLPPDWDILFLGHCFSQYGNKVNEHLYRAKHIFCTHCYCISQKAYPVVIERLKNSNKPIDHIYDGLIKSMNIYMCKPSIVNQIPNLSDIGEGPNNSNNYINHDQ